MVNVSFFPPFHLTQFIKMTTTHKWLEFYVWEIWREKLFKVGCVFSFIIMSSVFGLTYIWLFSVCLCLKIDFSMFPWWLYLRTDRVYIQNRLFRIFTVTGRAKLVCSNFFHWKGVGLWEWWGWLDLSVDFISPLNWHRAHWEETKAGVFGGQGGGEEQRRQQWGARPSSQAGPGDEAWVPGKNKFSSICNTG